MNLPLRAADIHFYHSVEQMHSTYEFYKQYEPDEINALQLRSSCFGMNPIAFSEFLAEDAIGMGLNAFTNVKATEVEHIENGNLVKTTEGTIQCEDVVFCVNAWTSDLIPELKDLIKLEKHFMVSTVPEPNFTMMFDFHLTNTEYVVWEDTKLNYIRRVGNDGAVIIGGLRDAESNFDNLNDDYMMDEFDPENAKMAYHLLNHFVGYLDARIKKYWVRPTARTRDGLPWVGPLRDNQYICAGFNGNSLSWAYRSGICTANFILGKDPRPYVNKFWPMDKDITGTSASSSHIEMCDDEPTIILKDEKTTFSTQQNQ